MGAEEFTEGGLGIEETLAIAKELCRNGLVDYLSLAQGIFNTIETHLPDRHWPAPAYKDLHARFKAAVPHVAVITSSRIQTPEQAEAIIANGEADMVAMCRALVVDPEWAEKARKGHSDRIRKCIACNQCWGWISAGEPIACATNPVAGREWRWKPIRKSKVRKRVIVVGGGPAGLEAARVAAFSGHDVTLLEREAGLGGRMRGVSLIPHHAEMAHLLDFLVPETRRAGARIETGHTASAESILALAPDAIVIATGSTAETPEIASDNSVPVRTADGPVELAGLPGGNVVLVDDDGYYWASAVAESLVASGRRITIATRFFEPFREIPITSRIVLLREMDAAGASLRANTTVASASNGAVSLRHVMTGRSETIPDVAAIFWTGLARANGSLSADLIAKGFDKSRLHVVGDAFSPRRLAHALTEAHAAARAIASSPGT
jgi:NADPH-dependent 2,4-dienoyl-CoA reductase/sulfur reductase-like enzyme